MEESYLIQSLTGLQHPNRPVMFNPVCSAMHPPDSAGTLSVVTAAKSPDFSTKSNTLCNPRKSCRAFVSPSLSNTLQITSRKFLTLKCESCLVPAWFHLPGMTLRTVSLEQQVTAHPGCAVLTAVTSCGQRGVGKGHMLCPLWFKDHLEGWEKDQSSLFTHFHTPRLGHRQKSVMLFIKVTD